MWTRCQTRKGLKQRQKLKMLKELGLNDVRSAVSQWKNGTKKYLAISDGRYFNNLKKKMLAQEKMKECLLLEANDQIDKIKQKFQDNDQKVVWGATL